MPMHQLDSLFHKAKIGMKFVFGFEADNHGINTVPKETLVKVTKAEDGGIGGKGLWDPAKTGYTTVPFGARADRGCIALPISRI